MSWKRKVFVDNATPSKVDAFNEDKGCRATLLLFAYDKFLLVLSRIASRFHCLVIADCKEFEVESITRLHRYTPLNRQLAITAFAVVS